MFAAPHQELQNPRDPPQRRQRDPALRSIETLFSRWRDAPDTGLHSFFTAALAAHVSFPTSSTKRWSLHFAPCDGTVAACAISMAPPEIHILAQVSQFLTLTSCRGRRECVGKSEHNRNAHFLLDHFVELFFCIHDLV